MNLKDWIGLKKGDKITRDGKKIFTVEQVGQWFGNRYVVTVKGTMQTEHQEWEKVNEVQSQD